ncbi:hypothetical protein VPH35_016133 [Triticum aestivum]
MDGYGSSGDDAERRRCARSDAARKRGARRWLNRGSRPPPAFERRELVEFERELARRRYASSGSSAVGSSSAGASSSRLTPVKREPEELGQLAVKLEAAVPPRRGVIGPEDYLPPSPGAGGAPRARRHGVAHTSKEADLHFMKAEQAKFFIDLDSSNED